MGLYKQQLQAPTKVRSADWIPEDGELFRDASGDLYMGDNVTPSDQLTAIGSGGGSGVPVGLLKYAYDNTTSASGITAGQIRFNSTTFGSITKCYLSDTDALETGYDQEAYLDLFTSGILSVYGLSNNRPASFKVTRMVEQTGYHEFDVTPQSGILPTSGDYVGVGCAMDAPGVRRFKASVDNASAGTPVFSAVHINSLIGTPILSTEASNTVLVLELANGFGLELEKTHGIGSANGNSQADSYAGYLDGIDASSGTIRYRFSSTAALDLVEIYLEVYN